MVENSKNNKNNSDFKLFVKCYSPLNKRPLKGFVLFLFIQLFFLCNASGLIQKTNQNNTYSDSLFSKIEAYNKNFAFNLHEYNSTLINEAQEYINLKGKSNLKNVDFYLITYLLYHAMESKNINQANKYFKTLNQVPDLSTEQKQITKYWEAYLLFKTKNYSATINILKHNELLSNKTKHNSYYTIKALYCIGLSYYNLSHYNIANKYFNQALTYCQNKDAYYYNIITKIAFSNYHLRNLPEAIKCIDNNLPETVSLKNTENELWQCKLLQLRAYLYRETVKGNYDSLGLLKKSMADCELSVVYLNRYLQKQYLESDQLTFNNKYNYIYYKTIEAISRVNSPAPKQELMFKALYYAELDKNKTLLQYFIKQSAQQNTQISPALIQELDSLHKLLSKTKGEYQLTNNTKLLNKQQKKDYYKNKGQLIKNIHNKEENLKQLYPDYAELCNSLAPINTEYIKELSQQKQIIEYVLSDEKMYTFLISDGKIHIHNCELTANNLAKLERFRQLLGNTNNVNYSNITFHEIAELGYELYAYLLKPLAQYMNNKPLLIIADNELTLIPFEALLNKPYKQNLIDYSELPYLVKNFDISYANSLHLLKLQKIKTRVPQTKSVLTYSPTYKSLPGNTNSQFLALRHAFGNLGELKGARIESENISKKTSTVFRIDNDASEAEFKKEAKEYSVIHCAMHTLIDNANPHYSKLIFTPYVDNSEDGLLHNYEISELQLNCDLLVLSACNTGYGKINKGEGALSLSREFTKSGSKSILSTLWSVSDASSIKIMDGFYDKLLNKENKSASLSSAKRNYLQNNLGFDAHPFFWAAHIVTGNDEPVHLKASAKNKWILLFAFCSALLTMVVYFGVKRRYAIHKALYKTEGEHIK